MNDVDTPDHIDLDRLSGTWYDIARIPHLREKNWVGTFTTLQFSDEGKISVAGGGRRKTFEGREGSGSYSGWVEDLDSPSIFRVRIFGPFSAK